MSSELIYTLSSMGQAILICTLGFFFLLLGYKFWQFFAAIKRRRSAEVLLSIGIQIFIVLICILSTCLILSAR